MDARLKKLIESHPSLQISENGKRMHCNLSGHEMPCKVEAIEDYLKGKKYQRLSSSTPKLDPSVYSQFLVPSNKKQHEKQLFCKLTLRHLNNLPHHIAQHVNGKRFVKALERWNKCQETGEIFKPNTGRTKQRLVEGDGERDEVRNKKKKRSNKNEDVEDMGDGNIDLEPSDDDDDNDSLSDLYPVEYLEKLRISAEEYDPAKLKGVAASNGAAAASSDGASASSSMKSSKLKRKMQNKKKPATLKTVKTKKAKNTKP